MAGEVAARRHAQAVFQIASEKGRVEEWRSDLELIAAIFGDAELVQLLGDPKIRFEDKVAIVARNLPGTSETLLNLVKLVITRRRVRILPQIAREYARLADRQRGIEHAEVTTATPVDRGIEELLARQLAKITGSEVIVSTRVDPSIVGGFVARVGDKLVDGSVRNRLQKLKSRLAQAS